MARLMNAGDICKEVLGLMGLPVPNAVSANTNDATSRQIWVLLRQTGRRLMKPTRTHRWQALTREWKLTTVPGKTLYDLPTDHDGFIDSTAWNLASRLPMLGALDAQWQALRARSLGSSTISIVYRTVGEQFEIYNSPGDAQSLSIAYTSRNWVKLASPPDPQAPYADAPVADGDIVMLDPEMMVAGLQFAFLTAKGFDTTAVATQLDALIEAAIDNDSDAPVLSAVGGGSDYPLLSPVFNLPDTGYGS
ncbi:hypothetical protein GCM10028796_46750 [Ramlibacter monticola]|uniref:Uncharacterized protein n=1 Tax=Ramlibacter monticola TaxID=1926872 RepID=A0A936Z666_9BURK|nr:hypothetical protein [Ramlibacter monticola]MBL0394300.1 hypothetical protein [Ramlibacter monticola]